MEENGNQKKTVTAEEVDKIISQTQYGEYDQYHEWSPSYTLENKADFLKNMLKNWNITEPEGKKLLVEFTRTLIKESGSSGFLITDILVRFGRLPEIGSIVNEFLFSGQFCFDLLTAMKKNNMKHEDWLRTIRDNSKENKFSDKKGTINLKKLHKKIQELILELS